ncbi:MAG: GTP 3',8-cyclase MoaA [Longimicrobiales bacterium]|nr:GTP 3',8-cyclase MoaA [Longimicrobiales bacterium]
MSRGPALPIVDRPAPGSDPERVRAGGAMVDGFGRTIEYLRVSVTDKCNLRCVYCMPPEGLPWIPKSELLSWEEIRDVVATMAPMGLRRVRLTGGEPLVRRDIPTLVRLLREIPGIEDLSLSTNAVLLADHADALVDAGLDRVNISLDSLRDERIDAIARRPGAAASIRRGIAAAERVGLAPIKLNVVVMRGRNDDEIEAFARMTLDHPWHIRFIEVMPTGANLEVSRAEEVTCDEVLERIAVIDTLEPVEGPTGNGPARYWRFPGAAGTIGVITPMSHTFCDRCNRMRLTADGKLRPCLFGDLHTDLRGPLRSGDPIRPQIERALRIKPERHLLERGSDVGSGGLAALSQTGG